MRTGPPPSSCTAPAEWARVVTEGPGPPSVGPSQTPHSLASTQERDFYVLLTQRCRAVE